MRKEQCVGLMVSLKEMHPRGIAKPCFLWEIDVMAGGAAAGAHLQKRLGMCFLSPFPCFHGNSSKQEQPAWNFAAYRSDTPCPIIPADFGS